MKRMKKFASLALALVMTLAMMAPVFAAGNGTITISNATIGEDYSIYKIFDATYDDNEHASYTIKEGDAWYKLVNKATDVFTLTAVAAEPGTFNVAVVKDADVIAWLNSNDVQNDLPEATATREDVQDTTVTFDVTYGYYLVKSSLNGGGTLTVDNATPNATVIDKNQTPSTPVKKVESGILTDNSAEIDGEMNFVLTYNATNYDGDEKIVEYKIEDIMPAGMSLKEGSVKVFVAGVEQTTSAYRFTATNDGTDSFTVVIPWVNRIGDKYAYTDELIHADPSSNQIKVTYTATMNDGAQIDGNGNVNTAKFSYTKVDKDNTPTNPEPVTDTETVFTYALAIKKVNKGGQPLEGVKFALTDKDGDPVNVTPKDDVYIVDANATSNKVITNSEGLIIVKGVKGQDYILTETETVNGYNLLTKPVTVSVMKTGVTTTNVTKYLDEDGNVIETEETSDTVVTVKDDELAATVLVVVNFTGSLLPSTGGIGTTIFYVVGGILVAGAAILLVTRKRVEEQ